jgi:hypothetical protein
MSYIVDWSPGTVKPPITVLPNTADTTSTSIVLTGKGYPNYGEQQQENFIRMLEHFASTTAPAHPTVGQLWFNTTNSMLYVYSTALTWTVASGGAAVGAIPPVPPYVGQIWFNTVDQQCYVYDSSLAWRVASSGSYHSAVAPASPSIAQTWYDSVNQTLFLWSGAAWVGIPLMTVSNTIDGGAY